MKKLFPLVTADIALFTLKEDKLRALIIRRENQPAQGEWALPGGILQPEADTSLNDTARRVLRSKTGVDTLYLEQVMTASGPDRDPRGWSLSVLYYALLPSDLVPAVAGISVEAISWFDPEATDPQLAFDHGMLLQRALTTLRKKVRDGALPLHLLPEQFTLTDVQHAYEAVLGSRIDKGAFRRKIKDEPSLLAIKGELLRGPQRPAQIYRTADDFKF
jgi:8-oxo-dGTP diphosphatase